MSFNPEEYIKIPYVVYDTLEEKLQALLRGEILFLKNFEKGSGQDVLVRLEQKKFTISQISYDTYQDPELAPRYWITYNVGLNDLSLFTAIKFEEGMHNYSNKYTINDIVQYYDENGKLESAIIEEVYVKQDDYNLYAYKISGETDIVSEENLIQQKYM